MILALYRHSWRSQRIRLSVVCTALLIWGFLLPVIYAQFGSQFRALLESGIVPAQFAKFGGGDVFSLPGSIALSIIHPIAMILTSVFAVGFSSSAVAGERQRGYLEVVLARPISRRALYLTLAAASLSFVALSVTALLAGGLAGSTLAGVIGELAIDRMPLLWLNAFLLFASFAAIGLAASVSFDRLPPALGVTIGIVVTMYTLEVLGSLWPRAEFLQPYSLFHYLKAKAILMGAAEPRDLVVLAVVIGAATAWALIVFPRRDLAAPS
jgi:ABC-type transport system involved in multi-copper enzyme maturation permease subunit